MRRNSSDIKGGWMFLRACRVSYMEGHLALTSARNPNFRSTKPTRNSTFTPNNNTIVNEKEYPISPSIINIHA